MTTLQEALSLLRIPQSEVLKLQAVKTLKEAHDAQETFYAVVKKARRARALELHPDRGGDLEAMKAMNAGADVLMRVRIQLTQRVQPRPVQYVVVNMTTGWATDATTTGSTIFNW